MLETEKDIRIAYDLYLKGLGTLSRQLIVLGQHSLSSLKKKALMKKHEIRITLINVSSTR